MSLPTTGPMWAIRLSQIIQHFQKSFDQNLYPINLENLAVEISRQFFPNDPIIAVVGESFPEGSEGALHRKDGRGWIIFYNKNISSNGRVNFTIAHELGHYLLHRSILENGIMCSRQDMMEWKSEYAQREAEANQFASYLLMPRNLFEEKMRDKEINLHLLTEVAEHFSVSITAAILKWLEFTDKRAMLVIAKDGFVDLARSSDNLYKSYVYLKPKQEIVELPARSLAALRDQGFDNQSGSIHDVGVWPFKNFPPWGGSDSCG